MRNEAAGEELFAGLISGTSMDGIDAALFRFGEHRCETIATLSVAYPDPLRNELLAAMSAPDTLHIDDIAQLDQQVGWRFRDAANTLFDAAGVAASDVRAIGSHGQTLRHRTEAEFPFSMQIGDPNVIAQGTGVTTVADFRRRDIAAGGEGAPLTPAFHAWLFSQAGPTRCVLNLGGIANLTVLPASAGDAIGFDTGPANTLMDAWIRACRQLPYDEGGEWARSAPPDKALLRRLQADDYFMQKPPKSTGFERFNLDWLRDALAGTALSDVQVQSTLMALTVSTIADAVRHHAADCSELLACGGGVHNDELMARLRSALDPLPVTPTTDHGLDPDFVEAAAFAWLAHRTLQNEPGNLPSVTGASHRVVLGGIYPAP